MGAQVFASLAPEEVKKLEAAENNVNMSGKMSACFAPGTPIRVPGGWKNIEDIREGDLVLARDDRTPDGPVVERRVETAYVRTGMKCELSINGRVIVTTPEHPFHLHGGNWTPAGALREGMKLDSLDGPPVIVDSIRSTVDSITVHNLRVAESHTYFVGENSWGWSVWAHNYGNDDESTETTNAVVQPASDAIYIYVNLGGTSGAQNFDAQAVNKLLRKMLDDADLKEVRINVAVTTTSRQEMDSELGFLYDYPVSYYYGAGWWNLNPLQGLIVSPAHDLYTWWYRDVVSYTHYITIVPTTGVGVAQTGRNASTISENDIRDRFFELARNERATNADVPWDLLYANAILHEAIWLGLCRGADRPTEEGLKGGVMNTRQLIKITEEETADIWNALGPRH